MGRNKVRELSVKAWLKFFIPVILIMAFFGWASLRFVQPIPPKTLVMSTGVKTGPLPSSVNAIGGYWPETAFGLNCFHHQGLSRI